MEKQAWLAALPRLALALCLFPCVVLAADPEVSIVIKGHVFVPAEVKVPAGKKVKLIVENQDATAEEFESPALKREKVIPPRSKAVIFIGPLAPGKYPFVGEFHESSAHGVVIAE
jgi:plastocyanin